MNHEEYRKKTLAAFSGAEEEIAAYVAPNIEKYRKGTVKLRLTEKKRKADCWKARAYSTTDTRFQVRCKYFSFRRISGR